MKLPFTIKPIKTAEIYRQYYHNKLFYMNTVRYETTMRIEIPLAVHQPFAVFFYTLEGIVKDPVAINRNHYRAFFVPPGHHELIIPPGRHQYQYFLPERTLLQKIIKSNPPLRHLNEYFLTDTQEHQALPLKPINKNIRKILTDLQSKRGNGLANYVEILQGIHQLTTIYARQLSGQTLPNHPEFIVKQVKEYLISEIKAGRMPSLRGIIQEQAISARTFFNYFKEEYGLSPYEFINIEKMNFAHDLLVDENMRVNEVSALLGYTSQSTFASSFKNHFGYTPREAKIRQISR